MLPFVVRYIERREENVRFIRHRRVIRDNSEPFSIPERRFIELFRLNKNLARELINMLEPYINHPTRNHGISVEIAVLTALRFYATGSYQRCLGQDFNFALSQTSVHRCIHMVTSAIDERLSPQFITFPNTRDERQQIKVSFMERFGFPGVIGAIDCTHVAILKPNVEEHNFINRKVYHSLNVQAVCSDNLVITNLFANYGGSTHDAFIWRNSRLQKYLQDIHGNNQQHCWLLGDSGYPLQPYLLTPIHDPPPNSPEAAYNVAHKAARSTIETCFGRLKMRFRCILKERVAMYSPIFVASLITTCATLHNLCIQRDIPLVGDANDPLPPEDIGNDNDENGYNLAVPNVNLLNEGRRVRNNVVNMYFVQL
jgi:hypothetical protein